MAPGWRDPGQGGGVGVSRTRQTRGCRGRAVPACPVPRPPARPWLLLPRPYPAVVLVPLPVPSRRGRAGALLSRRFAAAAAGSSLRGGAGTGGGEPEPAPHIPLRPPRH